MNIDSILQLVKSRSFRVLPLQPRSKKPLTNHAYKDSTNSREQIEEWWNQYPDANAAIATGKISGIVVIDVDGKQGARTLAELESKYGPLPQTLTAITGRGKHLYYHYPAEQDIRTSKKLGSGIDLKSDGGYVVAPPSVHPDGTIYKWLKESAEIAALPVWVISKLTETTDPKITAGQRHDAVKKFACELANAGKEEKELRQAVALFNRERCNPPKPDAEVKDIVDWVLANHSPADAVNDYNLDWFAFNCRTFLGDTTLMALTDRQMGWWVRLNAYAWMNRGVLPNDANKLARLSGAEDRELFKKEMQAVLFEYEEVDGQLVNQKMVNHWNEKQELTKKRVKAGRARAEKERAKILTITQEAA
jgi:hypothetical protein